MINLWEFVTANPGRLASHGQTSEWAEIDRRGSYGQEISLGSVENGWVIRVHSCYTDLDITILVPTDMKKPVEIVSDNRAKAKCPD